MNEMVEKVARAIDPNAWNDWYYPEKQRADWQSFARNRARAAIAAMREPTKAMFEAVATEGYSDDAIPGWDIMINAALSDPEHDR